MTPLDHVDDYPEIPVSLGSTRAAIKTGGWRSVRPVEVDRTAPCAFACPAGVAVPEYLDLVRRGHLDEALAVFTERNPFPRITGRVCPHICEDGCNLAVATGDAPVAIRSIERWLGDATAQVPHPQPFEATRRHVAVVGSGPAGLAAAYYLRRSGHRVTVYERRPVAGGMLRHAIPEYRLPAAVVDAEIARLSDMGVEFLTGVELGRDFHLEELAPHHSAVFLATGACRERPVGISGEHLLDSGLGFLGAAGLDTSIGRGVRCAVIGGGNTALDVARVARRLGAEVTVLYRRTAAEMPAIREEYHHAVAEGVVFEWLTLPRSVEEAASGLVVTVEEMRLGDPDGSGRRRPEATGRTRRLAFDRVFCAVGEIADSTPFPANLKSADGWLEVGPGGATADPTVHAGGDLVTGPATVVAAIAAGREAARLIDRRLGFSDRWPPCRSSAVVGPEEVNASYRSGNRRVSDPSSHTIDPLGEETLTVTTEAALAEIERCLSCGHCNACGTCFVFCPDGAIRWEEGGPVIDLEFCKGCGICVVECPGRALVLINEREAVDA
jgi:NADPH-dependent glutamate synthase beta subunit-like oxidoreductase/Pyruvate/2-oxoacid:ferredoxin oxidoreductase delta subunit